VKALWKFWFINCTGCYF